jgi:hypothetical protein
MELCTTGTVAWTAETSAWRLCADDYSPSEPLVDKHHPVFRLKYRNSQTGTGNRALGELGALECTHLEQPTLQARPPKRHMPQLVIASLAVTIACKALHFRGPG